MAQRLKPNDAFKTWIRAKLCLSEDDFDDDLFDQCEACILTQDVADELAVFQIVAVTRACLEGGGRSDGLDHQALANVAQYLADRLPTGADSWADLLPGRAII